MPDKKPDETRYEYLKRQSRWRVKDALKFGKIRKGPCEVCGDPKVEAHHLDYSKPLEVRWLCHAHHEAEHPRLGNRALTLGLCHHCGIKIEPWTDQVFCSRNCELADENRNLNRNND